MRKPKVAVIGMGGTISSLAESPLELLDYGINGPLPCDEILGRFPELATLAEVIPVRFKAIPSFSVFYPEWRELLEMMDRLELDHPDLAGFVVLHGTGALEETAYFLSLTIRTQRPVVVVGAQRPPSAWSSDAGINLANAVRVAGSAECRDSGVLVLMNDEIHAPRDVTKTSTLRVNAFVSPDTGPLGYVDGDRITLYRHPIRQAAPQFAFDIAGLTALPRVDILYSYTGSDGTAARAFLAAGAQGIIVAGFPPGYTGDPDSDILRAAVADKQVVVVQASRGGAGRTFHSRRSIANGFIPADNLNPQKARLLLALALTQTRNPTDIDNLLHRF